MAKVTLSIDPQLWQEFRAECIRRGKSGSQEVTRLMQEQIAKWQNEQAQGGQSK